ncbi:hypothetical protein NQ314_007877 [Rhamnusium bicolor]|uniref:CCHC-type domain-containing protein n=1 Tax=Rhamnusium bicolor TaxID=1586634 RepID=A0AAV8YH29_9CUCU|nr:hypothetical protein NQ314_007877 [Rhamnusium bicolor]
MKYVDLLKTVRQTVNPIEIGVEVQNIKKTRSGELLLTVQNGAEKLEALQKEIKEKIPEATTSRLTSKKVLHIKDLNEVSTTEEIREAISSAISVKPEIVEVRALRPAYAGRQNVTVVLVETDAVKLTNMGRVKIGWTKCRVIERKTELKCFRCWEYGHTRVQCKGPDREHLCLKCSQEGHKAAVCKNKAYCVHCNNEGHQSGSPKCPKDNEGRKSEAPRPTVNN